MQPSEYTTLTALALATTLRLIVTWGFTCGQSSRIRKRNPLLVTGAEEIANPQDYCQRV